MRRKSAPSYISRCAKCVCWASAPVFRDPVLVISLSSCAVLQSEPGASSSSSHFILTINYNERLHVNCWQQRSSSGSSSSSSSAPTSEKRPSLSLLHIIRASWLPQCHDCNGWAEDEQKTWRGVFFSCIVLFLVPRLCSRSSFLQLNLTWGGRMNDNRWREITKTKHHLVETNRAGLGLWGGFFRPLLVNRWFLMYHVQNYSITTVWGQTVKFCSSISWLFWVIRFKCVV